MIFLLDFNQNIIIRMVLLEIYDLFKNSNIYVEYLFTKYVGTQTITKERLQIKHEH